jgi:hypothetical protein
MRPIPPGERRKKTGKPRAIGLESREPRPQWWTAEPSDLAFDLMSTARSIANRQAYLRDQHLYFARMHGGVQIAALSPTAYARPLLNAQDGFSIGLNVIENICSSAQAELAQNKPKATFSTDAGDFYKQLEAEKLTRWLEAQFYASNYYDIAPAVALDGLIFGTGILKIFENELTQEIAIERVFPWEIFIDQAEGLYGTPQSIYQTKYVDRWVLAEMFAGEPEKAERLRVLSTQPLGMGRDPFMWDTTADLLQVVEAWRLPSGKDTGDGRHVLIVGDLVLVDEEWSRLDFPFAFFRWRKRPFGFWGQGVCEQLAGIQKEINRLLIKIQRAFARLGITRIYVERGSKVNPAHLRANDGDIVEYTGQKPVTEAPASVNPEIFNHLWQLVAQAYKITGVAEMTAQGAAPPPGVDSGRAIRTLLANHSKRMMVTIDNYVDLAMQAGAKMIALAQEIAEREEERDDEDEDDGERKKSEKKKRGYVVSWTDDSGTEQIDFAEIDLHRDEYVMRPYPTSVLPSNPGEKMQVVQEWFNTGMIDGDRAMMLMDFPDTRAFADMNPAIAMYRAVMYKLNGILKEGKPWVPDSFIEPAKAKALAVPFLLNAERRNAPEERLNLLRECIEDLVALEQSNATQPAQGQGGTPQLPGPEAAALPGQVEPMPQMANPMAPAA